MKPPIAQKKIETQLTYHNNTLEDEYAWLRAKNWQEVMHDPSSLPADIREYLEAENRFSDNFFDTFKHEKEKIVSEIRGRIKEDDTVPPLPDGSFFYGSRYETGKQYPIFFRIPKNSNVEEILLDGNEKAEGKNYFRLGTIQHSPDHSLLGWSVDDSGSEYYQINISDLRNDTDLTDKITNISGNIEWGGNSQYFYYVALDDHHRPCRVFLHKIGTSQTDDQLIYEEHDSSFFVTIGKTQSGRYICINAHDHQTSEIHLIDAHNSSSQPQCIQNRQIGHEYHVEEHTGHLLILTNKDNCEDFKITRCSADNWQIDNWQDIIPHQTGHIILSMSVYANHMVWLERYEGLPRIKIYNFTSCDIQEIAFDEEAYSLSLPNILEYNTNSIRFSYSSMTTPQQLFEYDMQTKQRRLIKTQEIPSGHNADNYKSKRIFVESKDGEKIPVTLLHHQKTALDGNSPLLLYGYGAYGITIPAAFSASILSLVDRGFVYAIAHIRGGKDCGYRWYRQGRGAHKTNTFSDFITIANYLADENIIDGHKIIAHGGSAGGMLMGAIANMEPDLFKAIIAEVPFVDVLNTMLDASLPLTPPEWPEWGNPITSKEDYQRIASYSPYDNVKTKAYPDILAVAGLTDPRVTYWEPAKWIARLRDRAANQPHLLLTTNMGAGHGGASGRFDRLEEIARNWIFALVKSGLLSSSK